MKALLFALSLGLLLVHARPALCFHLADTFTDDASRGGASGVYFTGSPRHRGYTCAACHLDAPGLASLLVSSTPEDLFSELTYRPGETYEIVVSLEGETRGIDSAANYNTFALELLDASQVPQGSFFGFDENLLRTSPDGSVIFARGQRNIRATQWTFLWQAPDAGTGYVDLHLAGVDGNGAEDAVEGTSDPLGDDVMAGVLRLAEQGVPAPPRLPPSVEGGCRSFTGKPAAFTVLLLFIGLVFIRGSARAASEDKPT